MAKKSYTNAWKNCATCDAWSGERELNEEKTEVVVRGGGVGQCNGFWQGRRKYENDKCPEWKRWTALNEWDGTIRRTYP